MLESMNWLALLGATCLATVIFYIIIPKLIDQRQEVAFNWKTFIKGCLTLLVLTFVLYVLMIKSENHSCMADGLKFGFLVGIGIVCPSLLLSSDSSNFNVNSFIKVCIIYTLLLTSMGACLGALS